MVVWVLFPIINSIDLFLYHNDILALYTALDIYGIMYSYVMVFQMMSEYWNGS